ncbi:MAG: hypothetical protein IPP83_12930 [Flavobacteriales bacterium]|nr:hypothetical protein [Flavobacteriales bacterium]
MDLEELRDRYQLPEEVVDFCRSAGLLTLGAIQEHEAVHGTFLNLNGADIAVEKRLHDVLTAVRLQDTNELYGVIPAVEWDAEQARLHSRRMRVETPGRSDAMRDPDPDLERILDLFNLSIRAYNVCKTNELWSLSGIMAFSLKHDGFKKLRNCGIKTQMELMDMLHEASIMGYLEGEPARSSVAVRDEWMELILRNEYAKLSTKARNVLASLLGVPTAKETIGFFKRNGHQLNKLLRVGKPVLRELHAMRDALLMGMAQHKVTTSLDPEHHAPFPVLGLWFFRNRVSPKAQQALFNKDGRMTLLRFLDVHLGELDARSANRICLLHLRESGSGMTLEALGAEVGLTSERVRQVLHKVDQHMMPKLDLIADLPDVRDNYPELVGSDPLFIATAELTDTLNTVERTDWSPLFVLFVAQVIHGTDHVHVSWCDLFGNEPVSKGLERTSPFMVAKDTAPGLDIILPRLAARYAEKRREEEAFDLLNQLGFTDPDVRARLLSVAQRLCQLRYPEVTFRDGVCILPPNKKKLQEDILQEILVILNEPSHVSRIIEEWEHRFPAYPITVSGVRSAAIRDKKRFLSIGRTSTYGLRRWEKERPGLKGGTIRSIVIELLERSDVPVHIDDLEPGVKRFRPTTNSKNIIQNLRIDLSGDFTLLPGGFVGLSKKTYDRIPEPPIPVPGSLMRRKVIGKFVGQHRDRLAAFIAERCKASSVRIERVIDEAISERRLYVDSSGFIRSTPPSDAAAGPWLDEIPFPS